MKCPKCWSDKAYRRDTSGWGGAVFSALFVVPMQCGHCAHEFCVTRFSVHEAELASKPISLGRTKRRCTAAQESGQRALHL